MSPRKLFSAAMGVALTSIPGISCYAEPAEVTQGATLPSGNDRPPNIILILADDLGYGDVGFNGNEAVSTPHLDRLASEGVIFTDFHANGPTCTPTRAALLTGRYQQRSGLNTALQFGNPNYDRMGLVASEVIIPQFLREANYTSALIGKWHLGSHIDSHPISQGFDHFIGNLGGHVDYISKYNRREYDWWHGMELVEEDGYVTHLLTEHTLRFIRDNRDQPFFIFLSHAAPHTPHQLPGDAPVYGPNGTGGAGVDASKYYPMIEIMDQGVGEILDEINRLGLDRNTLVIFTSDNGPHPRAGSSGPFRGHKSLLYEGGHRVPFAARWPGVIPAGKVLEEISMTMDLLPTFLEIAGLDLPDEPSLDGVSLHNLWKTAQPLNPRLLFWDNVNNRAVRNGPWKLVSVLDRSTRSWTSELFNLDQSLAEDVDLSAQYPERLDQLLRAYSEWSDEVNTGAIEQPAHP